MDATWRSFLAGIIFHSATRSLYEDLLGKERYLRMVDVGWMSAWITVPIALVMIGIVLFLIQDINK